MGKIHLDLIKTKPVVCAHKLATSPRESMRDSMSEYAQRCSFRLFRLSAYLNYTHTHTHTHTARSLTVVILQKKKKRPVADL